MVEQQLSVLDESVPPFPTKETIKVEPPTVGKIYSIIPQMMSEIGPIGKSQRNESQGFNYRGVDAVYNAVHPLLSKYKIFPTSTVLDEQREERKTKSGSALIYSRLKMKYTFFAEDGSSISTEVVGEGMDSGDKASNKAMSAAYKYALFQLLCIPLVAVEPDEFANPEVEPNIPKVAPRGERTAVSGQALQTELNRWKELQHPEDRSMDKWVAWVQKVTKTNVDFRPAANWTLAHMQQVRQALDREEGR